MIFANMPHQIFEEINSVFKYMYTFDRTRTTFSYYKKENLVYNICD